MKKSEFKKAVTGATVSSLRKLGFGQWSEPEKGKGTLMLIPGDLFKSIPEGFPLYSISGKPEKFSSKKTDNDTRFGCLAYGVLVKK